MAFEKWHDFVDDMKHSWYFRIWSFLWLVCAIVCFAAFVVLVKASDNAQQNPGFRAWTEFPNTLPFPNFYIHLQWQEQNDQMTNISCEYGYPNPTVLQLGDCGFNLPRTECVMVIANTTMAVYPQNNNSNFFHHGSEAIYCLIATAGVSNNTVLGLGIQEDRTPLYLQTGTFSDVRISQENVKFKREDHIRYNAVSGIASTYLPGQPETKYGFALRYQNFMVTYFEEADLFNGWMGLGAIGGFFFFLWFLHAFIMGIIGCFLPNTSKFLGGAASTNAKGYNNF